MSDVAMSHLFNFPKHLPAWPINIICFKNLLQMGKTTECLSMEVVLSIDL